MHNERYVKRLISCAFCIIYLINLTRFFIKLSNILIKIAWGKMAMKKIDKEREEL